MLLSKNINVLAGNWSQKRLHRTPIFKKDFLKDIENILGKYKAIIAISFLLLAQIALYDFNFTEYTSTNHYGAGVKTEISKN